MAKYYTAKGLAGTIKKFMLKKRLVIIGSGPAGYTAAIYAARAALEPLLFEGFFSGPAGGQLITTTDVENYPGFPEGIQGPELMQLMRAQAERFGTTLLQEDVKSVDFSKKPFRIIGNKTEVESSSVILSTGAAAKKLDVPGADTFWQKGVTACAVCDGAAPIFRGAELFVIGGGDTAVEDALFLTKFASRVYIVHRRDELRASKIMAERAKNHGQIEILYDHVLEKIEGEGVVGSVTLKNIKSGIEKVWPAGGVFFAIGHVPNTGFLNGQIAMHDTGYIQVDPGGTTTSVSGVFAAGDVQDHLYRQAVTAAGSGCMAALDAERWLCEHSL